MIRFFKANQRLLFYCLIILGVRLILSTLPSFEYDEGAFRYWSNMLVHNGPSNFFNSKVFTNNPVGYLYFLWLMGMIKEFIFPFINSFSKVMDLLLKFPANLADILTGLLIFKIVKDHLSPKWAYIGFFLYVLNPATLFDSSIWGQYDGIPTFFLLLGIFILITKKIPELASICFCLSLALKPQTIAFAPIFGILIILNSNWQRWLLSLLSFSLTALIIYLPFFPDNPIDGIIKANQASANLFNCTSCFAFNFWGIFGNWQNDSAKFFDLSYQSWGIILLLLNYLVIFTFSLNLNKNRIFKDPYLFLLISILSYAFFMFLTRMHERYLFPSLVFLLLGGILLRSYLLIVIYFLSSIIFSLNLYLPYFYYNFPNNHNLLKDHLLNNFKFYSSFSLVLYFILLIIYILKPRNDKLII